MKKIIIWMLVLIPIGIIIFNLIPKDRMIKNQVDLSLMGEEVPVKIVTLNSYLTSRENYEIAYLLGDMGHLYVLCYDMEKFYVALWQPDFWKDIEVVDICAERPWLYAAALDKEGNVYVWEKEYLLGESGTKTVIETNKRENWEIHQLNNIPRVTNIYATHDQFFIVTDQGQLCMWSPEDHLNPEIGDMEVIDMETPILNVAASEEAVFILDEKHVLWEMENGSKKILQKNVKSIMQGGKGFVFQMMDAENEVYVFNINSLQKGYETVVFADQYEAAKMVFEDNISSISVNKSVAVVCTDKQEYYQWGWKENPQNRYVVVPSESVYPEPVKIDLEKAKYYMVIAKNIVYINDKNEMFVLLYLNQ